jgi:hypothetical protein
MYVPNAWSHVLKSILMWLTMEKIEYAALVQAFYLHCGENFGSMTPTVKKQLTEAFSKEGTTSSCTLTSSPATSGRGVQSIAIRGNVSKFMTSASKSCDLTEAPRRYHECVSQPGLTFEEYHRCLTLLPDLGNPNILAGLC